MPASRQKASVLRAATFALALSLPLQARAEPMLTAFHAEAVSGALSHFDVSLSVQSGLISQNPAERAKALASLEKMMEGNPNDSSLSKILDAMLETLVKGESAARMDAVKALSIIKDKGTLPALLQAALSDSNEAVREEAKRAIETISRE